jgi:AcrR family transcriptional regulator
MAPTTSSQPCSGPPRRRYAPRMAPEQRREHLLDAALEVTVEDGYAGISIESIAKLAGVTRPVIYDHFPNLGSLLQALLRREEAYALAELMRVIPDDLGELPPSELVATGMRAFLEAVLGRPATWRLILLPLDGTPAAVRQQVERNNAQIDARIGHLLTQCVERGELPPELDVELAALTIRHLAEAAGRMALTDPATFSPQRYERFAGSLIGLLHTPR